MCIARSLTSSMPVFKYYRKNVLIPSLDKEKMIKYTILSVAGIACLLTIGIIGLMGSRRNDAPKWL